MISNQSLGMCHNSLVEWGLTPVTCHLSPTPAAAATEPVPADSRTIPRKLVCQNKVLGLWGPEKEFKININSSNLQIKRVSLF